MKQKKEGRLSAELPVKYIRARFVYEDDAGHRIYGEWVSLYAVMQGAHFMKASDRFRAILAEYELIEARPAGQED